MAIYFCHTIIYCSSFTYNFDIFQVISTVTKKLVTSSYVEEKENTSRTIIDNPDFTEIVLPPSSEFAHAWFDDLTGNENMTIITAYWNLGSFQKGFSQKFTKQTLRELDEIVCFYDKSFGSVYRLASFS